MTAVKPNDKVRLRNVRNPEVRNETVYKVVEIIDKSVRLKHPEVCGHFITLIANIAEVLSGSR